MHRWIIETANLKAEATLFLALNDLIQSIDGIDGIVDPFILSDQSIKRVPDVEFWFGLEGGYQFLEQGFDPVFLIGEEIDDGGFGENKLF